MTKKTSTNSRIKDKAISFGTSGHRGIIGESFSIAHVTAITQAICDFVKTDSPNPSICLGYDPRDGNSPTLEKGSYTEAIASVCAQNDVHISVFDTYTPTPVVSWAIKNKGFDGGIILTASHNPKAYNGLKFNTSDGAPAAKDVTDAIQDMANIYFQSKTTECLDLCGSLSRYVSRIDVNEDFVDAILDWVQSLGFQTIERLGLCVDTKHGTTANVWRIFSEKAKTRLSVLHEEPLSDFNNIEPNPTKTSSLTDLQFKIKDTLSVLGVSNDPDGDRHIILDEAGRPLTPEESSVIIMDYFVNKGIPVHGIASTVASSALLKSFSQAHNISYFETAVGFKYFSSFFNDAFKKQDLVIGIESSGGFSTSLHSFDKCGFLPGILLMFIVKDSQKPISELKANMSKTYGAFIFEETETTFSLPASAAIKQQLSSIQIEDFNNVFSKPVRSLCQIDGLKIMFDYGWVLIRLSGTEPVARIYSEFRTQDSATTILKEATQFFEELAAKEAT